MIKVKYVHHRSGKCSLTGDYWEPGEVRELPVEVAEELVKSSHFKDVESEEVEEEKVSCPHCGDLYSKQGLPSHKAACEESVEEPPNDGASALAGLDD